MTFIQAQNKSEKIILPWDKNLTFISNDKTYSIPKLINNDFENYTPHFFWKKKISKNTQITPSISIINKIELSYEETIYYLENQIEIPSEMEFSYKNSISRDEKFFNLEINALLIENGKIYKINEIKLDLNYETFTTSFNKDFVNESVLNNPNSAWYKISVNTDGIHKIDKSFLESIGISTTSLNPNHLNVYGNGVGKLAELNSVKRTDDLAKNAILFVGNSDDFFDDGEYFLFYAWGPHKWTNQSDIFKRNLNIYSDLSYYFIRISSTETPKRISQIANVNTIETDIVNSYNFYDIHELETKSLVGGGQRWYGDLFDLELSKQFSFHIPNLILNSKINFISSFASNAKTSGNSISYIINGQTLNLTSLPTTSTDFNRKEISFDYISTSQTVPLQVIVTRVNPSILTYLDKIELNARCSLSFSGSQFRFRDVNSVGIGKVGKFTVSNVSQNYFIWDITDLNEPKVINPTFQAGNFEFNVATDTIKEFICSNNSSFYSPKFVKQIENQNLHGLGFANLLIVTHPNFLNQAYRLAQLHLDEDGTTSHVVTTEQVYNEFSSGSQDPTAIKWFAKMFYDRANGNVNLMPENLLLLGDGTYDPKNRVSGNNYFIPTYQVLSSEDHINALVTDDYFGMLDDNESISNSDMMDIGVGRMIVSTEQEAKEMVDKIEQYLKKGLIVDESNSCSSESQACSAFGDWRQKYVQIADDEEGGYFVINDTEPQSITTGNLSPAMNVDKLYLDAYQQITTAGGERFPDVYNNITDRIQRGTLLINYVGHGGEVGVAEERVITIPQIQSWTNFCKLNLFVSATCEFTKFDDPSRVSAGEWVYLNPKGGAIALMTTTRSVYFNVNTNIGLRLFDNVFLRDQNNQGKTFGEIMRLTKNQANSSSNKRSFNLIGDPALKIALPQYKIITDSINSFSPNSYVDTLQALSKVTIKGHIEDYSGNLLSDFNGFINPTIFDKKKKNRTLGQNSTSPIIEFETQKNSLYKGKATVSNGKFEFAFIVPKDINYEYGFGKISLYSNSSTNDAGGVEQRVIIGGINPLGLNDDKGPEIDLFFNTEQFVNGGLTDESPTLIAKIHDENGINTVGNGIGHDLVAIIDNETANPIILNDYYNSDLDTYQSGKVNYKLQNLAVGKHTLTLKVWDVNNNSSENTINFEVQEAQDFTLRHVLNYPNPFTTNTAFFFEHNQLCANLDVRIQIFTISGKLIKTINQGVYNECYRSEGITWDGKDDFGDQLAKGVYIYKLTVRNPAGEKAEKIEKLVILK